MNFLVVYVGEASKINLEHGIRNHIWGFKSDVIGYLKEFQNSGNSYILLGTGYTGGSPRAQLKEWKKNRLQKIYIAKLKGNFFHDTSPEWPDEGVMVAEKRYVERIRFEDVKILENVYL